MPHWPEQHIKVVSFTSKNNHLRETDVTEERCRNLNQHENQMNASLAFDPVSDKAKDERREGFEPDAAMYWC